LSGKNYNDEDLSKKQLEIIKLVSKGFTYREIADELYLSEVTIKYHMNQIKKKLSLKNRAQVISYAKSYLL